MAIEHGLGYRKDNAKNLYLLTLFTMAGPEGGPDQGGVVELRSDALERSGPLVAALGDTPTAEKIVAVLGQPGTGVTGTNAIVPAPGETAPDITALGGTENGIQTIDGDGDGNDGVCIKIENE